MTHSNNRRVAPPSVVPDTLIDAVDWALMSRRSIRAFLPREVPRSEIEAILDVARFSASGVNTQPWHVHVVTGKVKEHLSDAIIRAHDDVESKTDRQEPYDYYPVHWKSPYLDRRRKVGWDLYSLLRIEKGDKPRMHAQHGRNYRFFDAPVGLMFTIDRSLGRGSLLDYGMFMQSIMIAAKARGLDTCPQAAFNEFHEIISKHLGVPDSQMLVCGMSLGYADLDRIENTLVSEREPVGSFTTFHDTNN
ncbi:nitroreductase [Massilia sp. SYSU DXS3249]